MDFFTFMENAERGGCGSRGEEGGGEFSNARIGGE